MVIEEMKNIQLDHTHHENSYKKFPLSFLAHDMDIPMNVGSLFRIADALGVEKIYLTGNSIIPPNSKIKKTARSTEKYVPFSYEKNPIQVVEHLKAAGYRIISLELTNVSIDIRELDAKPNDKICLVIGSENKGVCQELLNVSDETVHIPMLGFNSSMNVAAACSIATFEILRRLHDGSVNFRIKRTKSYLEHAIRSNLRGFTPNPSARLKGFLNKISIKI